jgi:hypothetical protein
MDPLRSSGAGEDFKAIIDCTSNEPKAIALDLARGGLVALCKLAVAGGEVANNAPGFERPLSRGSVAFICQAIRLPSGRR